MARPEGRGSLVGAQRHVFVALRRNTDFDGHIRDSVHGRFLWPSMRDSVHFRAQCACTMHTTYVTPRPEIVYSTCNCRGV